MCKGHAGTIGIPCFECAQRLHLIQRYQYLVRLKLGLNPEAEELVQITQDCTAYSLPSKRHYQILFQSSCIERAGSREKVTSFTYECKFKCVNPTN